MKKPPVRKSIHGRHLGILDDEKLASAGGFISGWPDKDVQVVMPGSNKHAAIWDDFMGDLLADEWAPQDGTDTGAKATQAITAYTNGVVSVASNTALGDSGGVSGITGELNWKANQGALRFAARVKLPAITAVNAFLGLTDAKAAEPPFFEDSGTATRVSNATDGEGFLFSTQNSKTLWQAVGVSNNTDGTLDTGGARPLAAPVANVYETFEILLDTGGDADFYQNGKHVGSMPDAARPTIALAPAFMVYSLTAGTQRILDVDWVNVSANRDTGT